VEEGIVNTRLTAVVILVCASLMASDATAQEPARERLRSALAQTDRLIKQAAASVTGTSSAQARSELALAREREALARSAFAARRDAIAAGRTLQARNHAQRAIVLARGLPDPDRVKAQLDRTRDLLQRAGERMQACRDDRARSMLRVASAMQDRAEISARAGRVLGALQLTMSARERAIRAQRICRVEEDVSETADRALRRTDQVLTRAQEQAGSATRSARDALARAIELQEEAYREFHREQYESSLRLTMSARSLAHRALRLGAAAG
jgi:hypothetical protein